MLLLEEVTLQGLARVPGRASVSLELAEGEALWLQGPSGSGKSALLRVMALLDPPGSGRVLVAGKTPASWVLRRRLRARIGVIWQGARLLPGLTVTENLMLPARLAGLAEGEIAERTEGLLAWTELSGQAALPPRFLTQAQRARLALARAVVCAPELLLADEPTAGLDRADAARLLDLLGALHAAGTTLVVATRDRPDLVRMPGEILALGREALAA